MFNLEPRDHLTSAYHQLHWLPVRQRTDYKLCLLTHLAVSDRKVAGLSRVALDNGQVAWFNVTIGRQRRHLQFSLKDIRLRLLIHGRGTDYLNTDQFKRNLKAFLDEVGLPDPIPLLILFLSLLLFFFLLGDLIKKA